MQPPNIHANQQHYLQQLSDPRWLALRDRILSRDGKQCRHCRSGKELQVHHRQYHADAHTGQWLPPWQYHPAFLITLCTACHRSGHDTYKVPVFRISLPSFNSKNKNHQL